MEKNRITLFISKFGIEIYGYYFWRCLIKNGIKHYNKGLYSFYFSQFPIPWRKYLVQYSRNGFPYPKGSSTFFRVPESEDEVSGIVAEAFYWQRPKKVKLPIISADSIRDKKTINECTSKIQKDVKKYIKDGKIKSFNKLKSLHRIPIYVFANPVIFENKEWGCLVYDSEDDQIDYEKSYLEFISYSKIILAVISKLNSK